MRIDFDIMNSAMNDISDRLITEAAPGSGELKNSIIRRITTAAASFVIICLGAIFAIFAAGRTTPPITPAATASAQDGLEVKSVRTDFEVDGNRFTLEYTERAEAGNEIGSVKIISAAPGCEAEFVDTAGVYADVMMVEMKIDGVEFAILCNIKTGEVNDFMREALKTNESDFDISEIGTVTWRIDGSGIVFAALATKTNGSTRVYSDLLQLWAFETSKGKLYDSMASAFSNYSGSNLTVFPLDKGTAGDPGRSAAVIWREATSNNDEPTNYLAYAEEASYAFSTLVFETKLFAAPPRGEGKYATVIAEFPGGTAEYMAMLATGEIMVLNEDYEDTEPLMPQSGESEFKLGAVTVTVSWEYDETKDAGECVTVTEAHARGEDGAEHEVRIPYKTLGARNIMLAVDDESYVVCDLLANEVTRFDDFDTEKLVPDEIRQKIDGKYTPKLTFISWSGVMYIGLEAEIGTFDGAQHGILCGEWTFNSRTGELDGGTLTNSIESAEFMLTTPDGVHLIWENKKDGIGVLQTPEIRALQAAGESYVTEDEHDINYNLFDKTITLDDVTYDLSHVALWDLGEFEKDTARFRLNGYDATLTMYSQNGMALSCDSDNDDVHVFGELGGKNVLTYVNGEYFICDVGSGYSVAGLRRVFDELDLSPSSCTLALPDKWYSAKTTAPLVICAGNPTGNLTDDLNMPLMYVVMLRHEDAAAPGKEPVPGEEIEEYVPLHTYIIEEIHADPRYSEYNGISYTAEFRDNYSGTTYVGSDIVITVSLAEHSADILSDNNVTTVKYIYTSAGLEELDPPA